MDVRLPNGVVIRNVPDGTSKFTLMERVIRKGLAKPSDFGQEDYDATEGMSGLEKFRAGAGRGLVRTARSVGNMVGLVDDEDISDADNRDRALLDTGAGRAGNFVGEVAATLPVGGAAGAGARALAARALPRAVARLAAPVAEGAATGAVLADPGNRLAGATTGAAIGGTLGATASAVNRAAQGIRRTPKAQGDLDAGIPLTPGQAADGQVVPLFESLMAKLPGSIGRQTRALRQASDDARAGNLFGVPIAPRRSVRERVKDAAADLTPAGAVGMLTLEPVSMGASALASSLASRGLTSNQMRRLLTGYYTNKPAEFARLLGRVGLTASNVNRMAVAATTGEE
jgi:hypothetical protein